MDWIWFAFEIPEGESFSMTLCLQSKLSKAKIGKLYEIVLTSIWEDVAMWPASHGCFATSRFFNEFPSPSHKLGQGRSAIVDGINLDVPEAKYFGVCNSRSGTWGILAVFGKKATITFLWSWNVRTMLPWCFECNLESSQNRALCCYQSPDLQCRLATLVRALATFSQPWFCVQIILQARHKETLESGVSQEHVKQQPQSRVSNEH